MPFSRVGQGTWETKVYNFKKLPLSRAAEFYNEKTGSSYNYDPATRELISYDTILAARQKALWIKQMGLGGAIWWESSADKPGNSSLVQNIV
jgi:chitinase